MFVSEIFKSYPFIIFSMNLIYILNKYNIKISISIFFINKCVTRAVFNFFFNNIKDVQECLKLSVLLLLLLFLSIRA